MTTINVISSFTWVYLVIVLLTLFFIVTYNKEFNVKDLINYFIYLTHKTVLFFLLLTFIFLFMYSIIDFPADRLTQFLSDIMVALVFYCFLNYSVFFGIKLIHFFKDFFKKNDLFSYAFFEKKVINKQVKGK